MTVKLINCRRFKTFQHILEARKLNTFKVTSWCWDAPASQRESAEKKPLLKKQRGKETKE